MTSFASELSRTAVHTGSDTVPLGAFSPPPSRPLAGSVGVSATARVITHPGVFGRAQSLWGPGRACDATGSEREVWEGPIALLPNE
ncbi:hypothetical protein SKAU_G00291970 [Synaphobranchus kaupii]|uniref:Uncharacterized protein n=1 Tax=Synaphobranchus kaupii TaxID=118154 RepID=A0A9Q1EU27_SYNKA|nr:hypothetical protein SKAU_G00291970 [Synaphobranchus kaupii]